MSIAKRYFVFLLLLALTGAAYAQKPYVPDELKPWAQWVLKDREYIDCPFFFDRSASGEKDFLCAWPGTLQLDVTASGARFQQTWTVTADKQWVPLPGDLTYWPEQVSVGGRTAAVVARGSTPSVFLEPGRYNITGRFQWNKRPGELTVPAASGLLELLINGKPVDRPERNGNAVWFGERQREEKKDNAVQASVYRLVQDGIPTRLTTRMELKISGAVREELFGPALPEGFSPLALSSQLPARLEADGQLRVQVRPGNWTILLDARALNTLDDLALRQPLSNLPGSEVWSYRADDQLRIAVPDGLEPVDPGQVNVPGEWQQLPAFRIQAGQALRLAERSRGDTVTDNQLTLSRQLWLDFDGAGFTFADKLWGTMRSGWRLDMSAPFKLLSANSDGQDLLVTEGRADGEVGVELRNANLSLQALGRSDTRSSMPASGWLSRFDQVSMQLMLPPGHKLFAAIGADRAPAAWINRWQLLDFFLLLIVTIAAHRLFGLPIAALAFLTLTLSLHEPGAPTWSWLNLLAAVALVRVAPAGRLVRTLQVYRATSLIFLVIFLVPFLVGQIRVGLYPQLEQQDYVQPLELMEQAQYEQGMAKDSAVRSLVATPAAERARIEEVLVYADKPVTFERYAPNAIVQAGVGRPSWSWNSYQLEWGGPVDPQRTLNLVILPRWLVTILRFTMVLLLLTFVARFIVEVLDRDWPLPGLPGKPRKATAAKASAILVAALVLVGGVGSPLSAHAETPPNDILQELQNRLTSPPDCAPRCAEIVTAQISVTSTDLSLSMTVHALESVAIPLPGSQQGWRPEQVTVDGDPAPAVYRDDSGQLWILASKGQRRIQLKGRLPLIDSLEVPFPSPPRAVEVTSAGWSVAGVSERRLVSGSLQLSRLQSKKTGDDAQSWATNRFPAFVRVKRTVLFGLDWEVRTTVERVAPVAGAISLEIPLLDGESVISDAFDVKDGRIKVDIGTGQSFNGWRSVLPRTSPLRLAAADSDSPWSETWEFRVSETWHAEFEGLPASAIANRAGYYTVFHPRPGEVLQVTTNRPAASDGATLAFDDVALRTDIGAHSRNSTVSLNYRSTRGTQQLLQLPQGGEVQNVLIDGRNEPLRSDNGALNLPILPGQHFVEVNWSESRSLATREETPVIDLGAAAGNIKMTLQMPANRWVLATGGPRLGPAVLYWAELVALMLFAAILGRTSITPLKTWHWLLLGLGFSTFSWSALITVVVWLLVLGWRRTWSAKVGPWQFDLVQLVIAALTVAAMLALVSSMPLGLLGTPDMHIAGNGSYGNYLQWFADRSVSVLPQAHVLSLPLWIYKALILAWAIWVSLALVRWLPWGWECVNNEGLWRERQPLSFKSKGPGKGKATD